ncbi:MAG: thiamine phosphate synthase, partial [Caulobacteraceae bacterium]|nr:thiamine phosphate synthase [Caulobacteraceae bacterium]
MPPACRLYLVSPPVIADPFGFRGDLEAALSTGDVAALQIRLKTADDAHIAAVV